VIDLQGFIGEVRRRLDRDERQQRIPGDDLRVLVAQRVPYAAVRPASRVARANLRSIRPAAVFDSRCAASSAALSLRRRSVLMTCGATLLK
jgi:hypothetical protein